MHQPSTVRFAHSFKAACAVAAAVGLAGCTLATMATSVVGAQAEWYRLWLPSFPFLILLGSLWAYRLCVWLGRKDEQPLA